MNDLTQPSFDRFIHFAGFDWASDKHHIVVVDAGGKIVLSLCFDDDAEGWAKLREKIRDLPGLAVAIETSCGPAVERLLEMGLALYPLNPKVAQRYRDRKSPAGVKSDERDAFSFADALRTDGHGWRQLRPQDPLTAELRLLCRDEIALIEQRTALVNQLRAVLHEYYPAALEAFDEWTTRPAWEFVIAFPAPQTLAAAGKRRWQSFLHAHKLYRTQTADKRLEIFSRRRRLCQPERCGDQRQEPAGRHPCQTVAFTSIAIERIPHPHHQAVQRPSRQGLLRLTAGRR